MYFRSFQLLYYDVAYIELFNDKIHFSNKEENGQNQNLLKYFTKMYSIHLTNKIRTNISKKNLFYHRL